MTDMIEQYRQLKTFKDYCENLTAQDIHLMLRKEILEKFTKNMKEEMGTSERFHAIGFQAAVEACLSLIEKQYLRG